MREWRLRTAQRSFYRPANCAAESVRGTRPIVARKKIAIGVSIGALDFMSRGVEKFPPGSYGASVTKIASLEIQRESHTRDDRSDDRFWLERKGKAVTGVHWLARIDSREMPQRAFPQSRSNLNLGRIRKAVFLYGNQYPRCRDFEWTTWHTNRPARLMIADEKIFSLQKSGDTPATPPFSSTRSLNTTQQTQNKNGLHCLLLHRLRRGPQGDQDPGAHLPSVTRFPAVRSGRR